MNLNVLLHRLGTPFYCNDRVIFCGELIGRANGNPTFKVYDGRAVQDYLASSYSGLSHHYYSQKYKLRYEYAGFWRDGYIASVYTTNNPDGVCTVETTW